MPFTVFRKLNCGHLGECGGLSDEKVVINSNSIDNESDTDTNNYGATFGSNSNVLTTKHMYVNYWDPNGFGPSNARNKNLEDYYYMASSSVPHLYNNVALVKNSATKNNINSYSRSGDFTILNAQTEGGYNFTDAQVGKLGNPQIHDTVSESGLYRFNINKDNDYIFKCATGQISNCSQYGGNGQADDYMRDYCDDKCPRYDFSSCDDYSVLSVQKCLLDKISDCKNNAKSFMIADLKSIAGDGVNVSKIENKKAIEITSKDIEDVLDDNDLLSPNDTTSLATDKNLYNRYNNYFKYYCDPNGNCIDTYCNCSDANNNNKSIMGFKKLPYYFGKSQFACICNNDSSELDGEIYKPQKILDNSNDCSINVTDVTCINNIMGKDIDLKDVDLNNQCPNVILPDDLKGKIEDYLNNDGKSVKYAAILLIIFIILIITIVIIILVTKGISKNKKQKKVNELIKQGIL